MQYTTLKAAKRSGSVTKIIGEKQLALGKGSQLFPADFSQTILLKRIRISFYQNKENFYQLLFFILKYSIIVSGVAYCARLPRGMPLGVFLV